MMVNMLTTANADRTWPGLYEAIETNIHNYSKDREVLHRCSVVCREDGKVPSNEGPVDSNC
jgi:hypothetical protein